MKLFDKLVKKSKPIRDIVDKVIFSFLKKRNQWSLLDNMLNKPVLIVGNGPSLNQTDFEAFSDHISIGMNKINLIYDKTAWRPDIIVCVNGSVLWQNKEFFNTTDTILFVPPRAIYLGIKKRKNVFVLNFHSKDDFSDDIKKTIANGVTVSYPCLQIANYLNPQKVSIVGIDHSYKFEGKNQTYKKFEGEDMNHFSKDYFKNQIWGTPNLEHSEVQYEIAKQTFDEKGIEIIDYTVGGKLEVFVKRNLNERIANRQII
ncbi:6-hydroxymethylpterin diphosphokinase MptE-like protein [Winogradskyella tangerina]|uniref:6-hydroxymethylpterin diphosphokinase MptE-like protein n=1 Tax=Winogradskyella tangerina TaxID=2023240 RepID=UPI000DBE381D|nr:6-hydroxymethylpterin diphosphokinase MptE-like protein [Winogradskyella tangerina]